MWVLEQRDAAEIGLRTSRHTVVAAAVYTADRVTLGKTMTQADVVEAGSKVVETSQNRIKRYSSELRDVYRSRPWSPGATKTPADD